jgi:hypothetical protein
MLNQICIIVQIKRENTVKTQFLLEPPSFIHPLNESVGWFSRTGHGYDQVEKQKWNLVMLVFD